ncbi:MAG: GatB/YqeY domain-containing protein [Clostridiales bacterium]|nr:GatB/YqeY domain-containing protein [Clostridiales bacterium]MCF8022825.1 GatB/YqeY domain-containing protein [Clostridiales bacterium]
MSIKEQLKADMKEAMKKKEKERLAAIRLLNSAIQNKEIEQHAELEEADILSVVSKEIKQTKESIEAYEKAGNSEEVEKLRARVETLEGYLPRQMTEEEVRELVNSIIEQNNIQGKQDKGKLMKVLMPEVKGKADNKMVSSIVDEMLS